MKEWVSRIFTSWNQTLRWLQAVDFLRIAPPKAHNGPALSYNVMLSAAKCMAARLGHIHIEIVGRNAIFRIASVRKRG